MTVCTIIAAVGLSRNWPVLLASVRDEAVDRLWMPPAQHWPGRHPDVIGGLDLQSGGTWLALDRRQHRASFLINRPERIRGATRSRGRLPLIALDAPEQYWSIDAIRQYNGFILGQADAAGLLLHEWDTRTLSSYRLGRGVHGLCYRGIGEVHPRLKRHLPLFAASPLPQPDINTSPTQAWGRWLYLLAGDGQYSSDADALIWRREIEGSVWASQSAACIALGPRQSRLDFNASPLDPAWWSTLYPLPTL